MSTRAKFAAVIASAGVLGAGWAAGTANGATVASPTSTGATNTGPTTSSTNTGTTTTSSGGAAYKDGTYTGTTVRHVYGSVTVTVTISGGKITNVTAQALDGGDRRSQSIDNQVVPIMKSEVLSANSAKVSTISGATYTSSAYITSLQSALAKA